MTEKIIIEPEGQVTLPQLKSALGTAIYVEKENDRYVASVPDSRDAEEEVTDKLNGAGILAFVMRG